MDPSNARDLRIKAKARKVEKCLKAPQVAENNRQEGHKKKVEDKSGEDVVRASVKEQEKSKMMEAEVKSVNRKITHLADCSPKSVINISQGSPDIGSSTYKESFQLDLGEFPLDASLLENGSYSKTIASKLVFPADAKRFGNTSVRLLADHLITASTVTNQVSCEAARRLAVEARETKYEEENRLLKQEVLELKSKLNDATTLIELTKPELGLSLSKVNVIEAREKKYEEEIRLLNQKVLELKSKLKDATTLIELTKAELGLSLSKVNVLETARKKGGSDLQLTNDHIQEAELQLKSKREAAKKEKEETLKVEYQNFIKDLAKRDKLLATNYYIQGRNSAKIQAQERPEPQLEFPEVDQDPDDDDYQSSVQLKAEQSLWEKYDEKNIPVEVIHADRSHKLLMPVDTEDQAANVQGGPMRLMTEEDFSSPINCTQPERGTVKPKTAANPKAAKASETNFEVGKPVERTPIGDQYEIGEPVERTPIGDEYEGGSVNAAGSLRWNLQGLQSMESSELECQSRPNDDSVKDEKMEDVMKEKGVQDLPEYEKHSCCEEEENRFEDVSEEDTKRKEPAEKKKDRKVPTVPKKPSPPAKITQKRSLPDHFKVDECSKELPRKKKHVYIAKTGPSTALKSAPKEKNGKEVSKEMQTPSDTELRDAIREILKEVDFNTATPTYIVVRLGNLFKKDLNPRKPSIRLMIQEELTKLADKADEEDGDSDRQSNQTC